MVNILPIFGRDKEKNTILCFLKHAEIIEQMTGPLQEAVDSTFKKKKDFKLVMKKAKEIKALEKEADIIRRQTATLLYEGAFLPVMRSRFYDLSSRTDNVADTIKNVANLLHYLKDKKISNNLAAILHKLGENAAKASTLVKPALQALFENKKEVHQIVDKIKELEEESDIHQRELFDKILFDKKMNPVTVQIIGWIGHRLSKVCDDSKKVSDTIILLKIMGVA